MKKIISLTLIICCCFFTYINAQAAFSPRTQEILNSSIVLKNGSNVAFVNNQKKNIDTDSSITPLIKNGRTLLPMRFISESLGATVSWDSASSTAIIQKESKTIKLTLGKNVMLVNDIAVNLEATPEAINGRTYVPLRALAEVLDQKVYWNNKGIIILNVNEISFREDAKKELEYQLQQKNNSTQATQNTTQTTTSTTQPADGQTNTSVESQSQSTTNTVNVQIDEKLLSEKAKYIEDQVISEIDSMFPKIVVVDPPKPPPVKPTQPQTGVRDFNTIIKPGYVIGSISKNSPYYASYTSKKASGEIGKGVSVEIIRDKDMKTAGHWYQIRNLATGQVMWVQRASLNIPPDPRTNPDNLTQAEIEAYVNSKGFSSKTSYFMWVDIDRQTVYVLTGRKGEWKLAKVMSCATGKNVSPTIRGLFTVGARSPWMDSDPKGDNVGVMNWVQFHESYLFHSVIVDNKGRVRDATQERRASHGCIRLLLPDSKWVYDNISSGTTVYTN